MKKVTTTTKAKKKIIFCYTQNTFLQLNRWWIKLNTELYAFRRHERKFISVETETKNSNSEIIKMMLCLIYGSESESNYVWYFRKAWNIWQISICKLLIFRWKNEYTNNWLISCFLLLLYSIRIVSVLCALSRQSVQYEYFVSHFNFSP